MTKVITMMTALVPTIGHKALIDFCESLKYSMDGPFEVCVIVGTMDKEPVDSWLRVVSLMNAFDGHDDIRIIRLHKDLPQQPEEHPDFWNVWRDEVVAAVGPVGPSDIFVASELYGLDMARVLGCRFLPFNRYRDMLSIKGSDVRANLLERFNDILPEFQPALRMTTTIFGPESCGKTTMAKRLAKELNGLFVPEWAREYLETLPTPETTDERMLDIVQGQMALQATAQKNAVGKPFIFQDTDLLSTLGYYQIFGGAQRKPLDYDMCYDLFQATASHLYIVMNDNIPFEADPLRYGGDKRESTRQYWIDLLKEHGCKYYVVEATDHDEQFEEIKRVILSTYMTVTSKVRKYER